MLWVVPLPGRVGRPSRVIGNAPNHPPLNRLFYCPSLTPEGVILLDLSSPAWRAVWCNESFRQTAGMPGLLASSSSPTDGDSANKSDAAMHEDACQSAAAAAAGRAGTSEAMPTVNFWELFDHVASGTSDSYDVSGLAGLFWERLHACCESVCGCLAGNGRNGLLGVSSSRCLPERLHTRYTCRRRCGRCATAGTSAYSCGCSPPMAAGSRAGQLGSLLMHLAPPRQLAPPLASPAAAVSQATVALAAAPVLQTTALAALWATAAAAPAAGRAAGRALCSECCSGLLSPTNCGRICLPSAFRCRRMSHCAAAVAASAVWISGRAAWQGGQHGRRRQRQACRRRQRRQMAVPAH